MKVRDIFIFISLLVLSLSRNLAVVGYYCDEWTKNCNSPYKCQYNQCVLIGGCKTNQDCSTGYICQNRQRCVPTSQPAFTGRYCDPYTPCSSGQCIQRKCTRPFCNIDNDCPIGFRCIGGYFCGSDRQYGMTQGRCDQWTKCPNRYKCDNGQCVPAYCLSNAACVYPYTCQMRQCVKR